MLPGGSKVSKPSSKSFPRLALRASPKPSTLAVMRFAGFGKKKPSDRKDPEFQSVTGAQSALSEDIPARQRKYFISMMIRTLCFLLAVFTPSPYRWFFLVGAITLPYISVIVANAGRETIRGEAKLLKKQRELS